MEAAIARALSNEDRRIAETRWCDAFSSKREAAQRQPRDVGSRVIDSRAIRVRADAAAAFTPVRRIGGEVGWYWGTWLWQLRGFLDLLFGGVGVRRGRRDPEHLRPGDALDFWRVDAYEPDRLLRLRAEMKVPGRAWLQFEVEPQSDGRSEVRQTALFDPRGLRGLIYWYGLYPLHLFVFAGMLREIGKAGEEVAAAGRTGPA